jgi:hypothetical protein
MPRLVVITVLCTIAALAAPGVTSAASPTLRQQVDDLQQEVDSLTEDVDDLREPVEEFELFDQCAYTIGVTQFGAWNADVGYLFSRGGSLSLRPALAYDMRGFGTPQFDFLSFPGEEPPSIECNEDAGEEFIDN